MKKDKHILFIQMRERKKIFQAKPLMSKITFKINSAAIKTNSLMIMVRMTRKSSPNLILQQEVHRYIKQKNMKGVSLVGSIN